MNSIMISDLTKTYIRPNGEKINICEKFNLNIEKGKIYSIVGDSGSGKTTLINIIAGYEDYDGGEVLLDNENELYRVGILFQNNVLFPWKTIMDNMLFALKERSNETREIVLDYLHQIGLENIENCYPNELSGGMQQRIALVRILLTNPDLVILDEAFGAMDFLTRNQMQEMFLKMHQEKHFTAIVVTHDLLEAVKLSDYILVFYGRPLKYETIKNDKTDKHKGDKIVQQIKRIILNKEEKKENEYS